MLVLEAQPEVGGAVRSAEDVHPGYVHDTFSAFYPLAAASPSLQSFRLEDHGLRWVHAPAVLGHPRPDGSWALLHRDRHVTAGVLDELCPGDGDAWLGLCAEWDAVGDHLVKALTTPFPPLRHGAGVLARLRRAGGLDFVRTMLTPVAGLGRSRFGGEGPRLLLAGNAAHADIPMDAPGSGLMGLLMTMLAQTVGYPSPEGGAGRLAQALARRITSLGGDITCEAEVTRVVVRSGRATAVRTADGQQLEARRAVVADVIAPALYGGLVPAEDLPASTMKAMRRFELDAGTVKVDWALSGPVPWGTPPPYTPGTVHVADSVEQLAEATGLVSAGVVPADPFLLVGQMTATDPTRSPAGTESLWAYTHVPPEGRRDAGAAGITGRWDTGECDRVAARGPARLERGAPGFGDRVVARRVLGPRELQARDANLVGGAINGGTAQLHQQLVLRPVPGAGRAETPVRGLYLGSASAHPGGGVHGAPGMNAARAAIAHDRLRRLDPRSWR